MNQSEEKKRSLIIAGMHRSYTSLTANAFHKSGLFLGDDLIGPEESNPYGHFESQVIFDFHRKLIKEHKLSSWWNYIDNLKATEVSSSDLFKHEAQEILKIHFNRSLFGWKDPMGAFFLRGWIRVLPDPHYLIVFRHPVDTVQSLIKRTLRYSRIKYWPFLSHRWFNLWDNTNQCLLDLYKSNPEKCVFLHGPGDMGDPKEIQQINEVILDRWGLNLKPIDFNAIVDDSLIKQTKKKSPYLNLLFKSRKRTQEVYESLQEAKDTSLFSRV